MRTSPFGLVLVLLVGFAASPAQAQSALTPRAAPVTPGIHCGFLADCTRFEQIGLHVAGLRGHGPLRARMPLRSAESEALAGEAPAGKARGGAPSGGVAEHTVPPGFAAADLPTKTREHVLYGTLDPKDGRATGWHYEPTGSADKGTYVIPGTRTEPDVHGVYEANAMIKGVKKNARSSFFPSHWTTAEIETAIEEAYRDRKLIRNGQYEGKTSQGMLIEMNVSPRGIIQTAYPVYQLRRR